LARACKVPRVPRKRPQHADVDHVNTYSASRTFIVFPLKLERIQAEEIEHGISVKVALLLDSMSSPVLRRWTAS
jgi:hypothetical protein